MAMDLLKRFLGIWGWRRDYTVDVMRSQSPLSDLLRLVRAATFLKITGRDLGVSTVTDPDTPGTSHTAGRFSPLARLARRRCE